MNDYLKYDLHTHTNWSDGRSPVRDMITAAQANGLKGFVLSDHVFSDGDAEKLLAGYASTDRTSSPVRIIFGCETAAKDLSGAPCAKAELLRKFELVLMDFNYILFSRMGKNGESAETLRDQLCDAVFKAASVPEVKILAHPFNFGIAPLNLSLKLFDNARIGKIAEECVRQGKIIEIMNQMYYWHSDTPFEEFHQEYCRILSVFKEAGALFSLGSDTHSCCGIGCLNWCARVVRELGLEPRLYLPEAFQERSDR